LDRPKKNPFYAALLRFDHSDTNLHVSTVVFRIKVGEVLSGRLQGIGLTINRRKSCEAAL
jgi:hypothetical protein